MRLITIPFSHFNERARWALDRLGATYVEQRYMPFFHVPAVMRATRAWGGRRDKHSTRYSTPVLVLDDGRALCDSGEIVRWASDTLGTPETTLYPAEQRASIEAFEQRIHDRVGGHARRVAYAFVLRVPSLLGRVAERNVSPRQARLFRVVEPLVVRVILDRLKVEARLATSLAKLRDELDALRAEIAGRRYLFADRFTAADLTLAALLAPLLLPSRSQGYGAALPELAELPADGAALVREVREHPVGKFCLRLFTDERELRATR